MPPQLLHLSDELLIQGGNGAVSIRERDGEIGVPAMATFPDGRLRAPHLGGIIVILGAVMANVLIRDLDEKVLKRLKATAQANGRSLQAEIHDALSKASTRSLVETRRLSARWLKRLRGPHSDSVELIREDRDRG